MVWALISAFTLYFGTGVFFASQWFHLKEPIGIVITTMFWPVILALGLFSKQ